jgi:hypothetical protein
MSCAGHVRRDLEHLFPGSDVVRLKKCFNRNSEIFLATISEEGGKKRQIAAKCPRFLSQEQIAQEYSNLKQFYDSCPDQSVSAPRPIFLDSEDGILFMDRLDAVTFGRLLHGLLPMSQERLDRAVDLSARALARCHTVFRLPDSTPLKADESAREGDINRCLLETEGLASASGLNIRVKPFFDFSIWNIMLGESKAYLIDFPNGSYVSSPHLDLGRFKFSLEMAKQYPPSKFFRLDWWHIEPLWQRFFARYCLEMKLLPNARDALLVERFKAANIMRVMDLTRKDKFHWQSRLEKAYFKAFSSGWLSDCYRL